jgi:enoyl-[acyl-carrier protein] reductase III
MSRRCAGPPVALVTGGSRGIGGAIVRRLARDGYRVCFNYLQDHDAADVQVEGVARAGGHARALQRNLAESEEVAALIDEVTEAEGRLDVMVSNAASGVFRSVGGFRPKHWRWTIDVNAWAFLLLVQAAMPWFEANGGGRIVALTSAGARRAIPGYGLVGASKAALEALVRQCAVELAPRAVNVNAVCPGLVETDAIEAFLDAAAVERARARVPLGRLVEPDDVASVVSFLCGPDARMITGQVIEVDGGAGVIA